MKIRVKLFAVAKQKAGQDELELDLPPGATIAALRDAIARQHPALADVMRHARLAVDSEYATDALTIAPTAEIAIIPPVSGG